MNRMASKRELCTPEFERVSEQGFKESLELLHQAVEFCGASLFVLDSEAGSLRCVAEHGEGASFIDRIQFRHGSGLAAWVAQRRRLVHLPNIHRGSRHGQAPIRSYLSMPIYFNDEVVGVLNLAHVVPNAFIRHKLAIVRDFCDRLAQIIRLYTRRKPGIGAAAQRMLFE